MRLLLTGDIHIGRASSSLSGTSGRDDTRAAAAWGRIVDLAIEERVDLLCLSGDIVDKENKLWEAVGPLESGVQRLAAHGIRIVAVAGNHDFDVLMRLDDVLQSGPAAEAFHLLGRRGEWERFTIEEDGQAVLHVDGWSFPREHVYESPLESYDLKPDSSTPVLGLVHGDLDVSGSRYAPLDSVRLRETGPDEWLLGHIHNPQLFRPSGNRWALYPAPPRRWTSANRACTAYGWSTSAIRSVCPRCVPSPPFASTRSTSMCVARKSNPTWKRPSFGNSARRSTKPPKRVRPICNPWHSAYG